MRKLFGTDGMRGEAGRFPLDANTVRIAGRSLARHLSVQLGRQPRIVTGRDTRESGVWIEQAFAAGVSEAEAVCQSAGVITTPGVAFLARNLPADAGVVISASHNPYEDNGIKIFERTGRKLDDAMERLIEADIYEQSPAQAAKDEPAGRSEQQIVRGEAEGAGTGEAIALQARYLEFLEREIGSGLRLHGLKIMVDCANGAASQLAPKLFARLGADVVAISNAPDGRNINRECGSLYIESLRHKTVEDRADLGVAFDGDADRALFVDKRGEIVDGDATLWVMAQQMAEQGKLAGGRVVATVMSNVGLELALRERGWQLLRTNVGDKYVLDQLLSTDSNLGGEQSGHIIFPRESLVGDGISTALHVLRAMSETNAALHELTTGFVRYPQVLVNVTVREKRPFEEVANIARAAGDIQTKLEGSGRLLLRYSGTELLARIMIEGKRQDEINELANSLAEIVKKELG
ncbi:MAG: phosphoglucosamine mutase [Pyrinomonadaceae bacterium]|nr:phosphoglucosamine mutase [Pyrinomonadaceae bacterium]